MAPDRAERSAEKLGSLFKGGTAPFIQTETFLAPVLTVHLATLVNYAL